MTVSNDLRDLYQEMILGHNKAPRNFRVIETADRSAEGKNPLCGDELKLYVVIENGLIKDIAFQGSGCAIFKASTSMMTEFVKGRRVDEIGKLFEYFHGLVTTPVDREPPHLEELGKLTVFSGVREFPVRVKCASLSWHTLKAALENSGEAVTTE